MNGLPRVDYQFPDGTGTGPLIALVGEAPGREEVVQQKPFVGRSGQLLDAHLQSAGIVRPACLIANVFRFQPPGNKINHFFASRRKALRLGVRVTEQFGPFGSCDYCLSEFAVEIEQLSRTLNDFKPAVIVALGRTPLWALTGLDGLLKRRGQITACRLLPEVKPEVKVVPTYHPSFLLRGQRHLEPLFQADLRLAVALTDPSK
ncbi:MAG: uracil-DNA glycosylase [Rhodospirillaceae bacterium]